MNPARLLLGILLGGCALLRPLQAAEDTNAPAAGLNLQAPELQGIRTAFLAARAPADTRREAALRPILQRFIREAEELLAEKRKVRNVKGVAIATTARDLFTTALATLETEHTLTLPDRVRRDLEPTLAEFQAAIAPAQTDYSNSVATLRAEYLEQFAAAAARLEPALAAPAERARLERSFDALLQSAAAPPATSTNAPAADTNAVAAASNEFAMATNVLTTLPPGVMAQRGDGSNWVTVGRWTAQMMGVDVVSIPVAIQPGKVATAQFNQMSGEDSKLVYEALLALPARDGYNFRLKPVADMAPVSVLEWPSTGNECALVVRTSPSANVPAPHGFELQVSLPDAELAALFPGTPVQGAVPEAPPVTVAIVTDPTGAVIRLDGTVYRDADGPRRTPTEIKVSAGTHSVKAALPGYLETGVSGYAFTTNTLLNWRLRPDPRATRKLLKVSAASAGWTPLGVKISKNDLIVIEASGIWTCGAKKEPCGPDGYSPDNQQFYPYYINPVASPRQLKTANYGALLVRFNDGTPRPVNSGMRVMAKDDVMLHFDINETIDSRARRDNTGAMDVKILIAPVNPETL